MNTLSYDEDLSSFAMSMDSDNNNNNTNMNVTSSNNTNTNTNTNNHHHLEQTITQQPQSSIANDVSFGVNKSSNNTTNIHNTNNTNNNVTTTGIGHLHYYPRPPGLAIPHSSSSSSSSSTTSTLSSSSSSSSSTSSTSSHSHSHSQIHDPAGILEGRKLYTAIMKQHTCYDLVPDSGKIVVFEVNLPVRKAFFALLQNGIRSAPTWDSSKQQFVGMLTVSDFINILRFYYKSPLVTMDEVEEHRIQTWREVSSAKLPAKIVSVEPLATLYDAARVLVTSRIHRLPLIDSASNSAVAVLTHKRILHFMHNSMKMSPPPAFLTHSISQLNIGTYKNIATASPDTPLIIVLNVFSERRVSCLPIVDENGVVIDVYTKYDVFNLARERTYNNLDVSVMQALSHRQDGFEGVVTCTKTDSFQSILDTIVRTKVHRLIVVDSSKRVVGIVSLSDILTFLML